VVTEQRRYFGCGRNFPYAAHQFTHDEVSLRIEANGAGKNKLRISPSTVAESLGAITGDCGHDGIRINHQTEQGGRGRAGRVVVAKRLRLKHHSESRKWNRAGVNR